MSYNHGAKFEEFSKFLLNLQGGEWYYYRDFPDRVAFNLPIIDKGVDLISFNNGVLKLVQCKYRSDIDKPLTFGHDKLSHLEAMGYRANQSNQSNQSNQTKVELIITTTAKRCTGIDDSIIVYADLMNSYSVWCKYNRDTVIEKLVLRDYQKNIIQKCMDFLKTNNSGLVTMPTGSGKTFTFTSLLRNAKSRRVIVAPTLALVGQTQHILNDVDIFNISSDNTTDPDIIATITANWIVTTYDSLELLRYLPHRNTLIVLDEAHNITPKHTEILKALPYDHKDLYFTATPTKYMDIPLIAEYSLEQAIANNYLVNFNVGLIVDSLYDPNLDPVNVIVSGILHCVEYYGNRKLILYCTTIAMVDVYYKLLCDKFPGYVGVITGMDSTVSRDTTISRFRESDIGILINVRILREGIDIPEIDTVVFSVQKHSTVDIMQCIGRALRKRAPKRMASVLVAYSIEEKINEKLAKALKRISPDISMDRIFTVKSKNIVDINSYDIDINRITIDWISDDSDWMEKFNLLGEYIGEFNCLPQTTTIYRDKNIGFWVNNQRTNYKRGKLLQPRMDHLNSILIWRWKISENNRNNKMSWADWYNVLRNYINEFNTLPEKRTVYKGINIGHWISHQRANYKKGKLSQDRIQKLQDITIWVWEQPDTWMDLYNVLRDYTNEFNALPEQKTVYRGIKIGHWISDQRKNYRNGKLSQDRIEKLQGIRIWWWNYSTALQSLSFWLAEYRKYGNSTTAVTFRQYNSANYNSLTQMQKILLNVETIPTEAEALKIIESTPLNFATKTDIGKNKDFFRIFCYYQGDLFSEEFTEYLTKLFSDNPLLSKM